MHRNKIILKIKITCILTKTHFFQLKLSHAFSLERPMSLLSNCQLFLEISFQSSDSSLIGVCLFCFKFEHFFCNIKIGKATLLHNGHKLSQMCIHEEVLPNIYNVNGNIALWQVMLQKGKVQLQNGPLHCVSHWFWLALSSV